MIYHTFGINNEFLGIYNCNVIPGPKLSLIVHIHIIKYIK